MSNHATDDPEDGMGFTWKPKKPKSALLARKPTSDEECDRCPAPAMFEITIMRDPLTRMLYLCGHHFETHRIHLVEHGYEVKEV